MSPIDFKLYMITDRHQTAGRSLLQVIEAAASAGIPAIQFREKDLLQRAQFELSCAVKKITDAHGVRLMINDRVDLCLALDAAGVHLPSRGTPADVARALLGPKKLIAVSCHSIQEVQKAESLGADFAVLGPIYDTPSKRPYGAPLGLDYFKNAKRETTIPLFAIGGITQSRCSEVFSVGAAGVAMISQISSAAHVTRRCRELLQVLASH